MEDHEVLIQFSPDSKNIEICLDPFTVIADGGDHTEPSPGVLFLSGVLACTASTARGYCFRNNLPLPTGIKASIHVDPEKNLIDTIEMNLLVPPEFPQDHLQALEKAAGKCTVKKWWMNPPEFILRTSVTA
jgi:ribosomal protein S12 methylthiotransferase accessory factor